MNAHHDVIVNKLLHTLFGGAVPIDRLEEAQALKVELLPIVQRTIRRPTGSRKTGPVSPESAKITARIVELYGNGPRNGGLTWAEMPPLLAKEGFVGKNGPLTKDACQHRYEAWRKGQGGTNTYELRRAEPAPVVEAVHARQFSGLPITSNDGTTNTLEAVKDLAATIKGAPLPEVVQDTIQNPSQSKGTLKDMRCYECQEPIQDKAIGRHGKIFCSKECAEKAFSAKPKRGEVESDPKTDSTIISMRKRGMNWGEIAETLEKRAGRTTHHKGKKWTGELVAARHEELMVA